MQLIITIISFFAMVLPLFVAIMGSVYIYLYTEKSIPKLVSIEGNIGVGKSTIVQKLKTLYEGCTEIVFLEEPVELWAKICDNDGIPILTKFYGNPAQYAFAFQVMAYSSRLSMIRKTIRENPTAKIIICERSLDADKEIFAKMLHRDGVMEDIMYQIYSQFYDEYAEPYRLSGIVYMNAPPDVCFKRIAKRGRDGEDNIKLDYLIKCNNVHTEWLTGLKNVLEIDASLDTTPINDNIQIRQIMGFIDKMI